MQKAAASVGWKIERVCPFKCNTQQPKKGGANKTVRRNFVLLFVSPEDIRIASRLKSEETFSSYIAHRAFVRASDLINYLYLNGRPLASPWMAMINRPPMQLLSSATAALSMRTATHVHFTASPYRPSAVNNAAIASAFPMER